eukprot:3951369-Prymnesium_polylepis.2
MWCDREQEAEAESGQKEEGRREESGNVQVTGCEKQRDEQHVKEAMQDEAAQRREAQRLEDAQLQKSELRETKKRRRQDAIDAREAKGATTVEKRRADADSKNASYNGVARFRVNAARGFECSHLFKTDGVSVRLLHERPKDVPKRTNRV